MADLNPKDVDRAKLVFDIYDFEGNQKLDAFYLGDALRALETNPTNALVEKLGGTKKQGEKTFTLEEFLPIYGQVKKEKEAGTYEDFMECLKLYDKQENGTMLAAELAHVLLTLGERLSEFEVQEIMKLGGPEDDDGFMKYEPWIKAVIAGPFPKQDE
jgi:myosin light chain 6